LTHHFLFLKNIRYPDVEENEQLTDVAAVYLGLGKLLLNGYVPQLQPQWTTEGWEPRTYQLGYISPADVAAALYHVCHMHTIAPDIGKGNLSEEALDLFTLAQSRGNEYHLKKQLVGHRQCPHCEHFVSFDFSLERDGLYCSECQWEWNAILQRIAQQRKRGWLRFAQWGKKK
jgi:hypothetical protein